MRAALQLAVKQRQSLLKGRRFYRSPSTFSRFHVRPTVSLISSFCSSALEESSEDSDADEQDMIARADIHVLFARLNKGLNSGSIASGEILDLLKRLTAAGATIPVSFLLDAVDLLARRREPHLIETILRGVKDNYKGFGPPSRENAPPSGKVKESSFEFDRVAAFGVKKTLRHSTVDAVTLWTRMTEWGYKASKADLTDFLTEISECDTPPDIAFTQRVTGLMHQNAWNNSSEYFRLTLSVYHKYLQTKNKDSLPALITVCNYFERAFRTYETRVTDSRSNVASMSAFLDGGGFKADGRGGQRDRTRSELAALDEEMHALRASFWVTAYSVSSDLRHVEATAKAVSGEAIHLTCKQRALGYLGALMAPGGETDGQTEERTNRFRILSEVFSDLQKDLTFVKVASSPVPLPASAVRSYPLDRLSQLQTSREARKMETNSSIAEDYNQAVLEDRMKGILLRKGKKEVSTEPGEPVLSPTPASERGREGEDLSRLGLGLGEVGTSSFDLEEEEVDELEEEEERMQDEIYVIEDCDRFNNNNRFSVNNALNAEIHRLNKRNARLIKESLMKAEKMDDQEGGSGESHPEAALSDFAEMVAGTRTNFNESRVRSRSTKRATEHQLRVAIKCLLTRLARNCHSLASRDELFLHLDSFLESSRRSSSFDKESNDEFIEELLSEVLVKARFSSPTRAVHVYRSRGEGYLEADPEFHQSFVPEGPVVKGAEVTRTADEKQEVWRREVENRFCNLYQQEAHINGLGELSSSLQAWCNANDIPLGPTFAAAWLKGLVCPAPSKVHYNKDMTRPMSDFDWTWSMAAAEKIIGRIGDENATTPEAYHALVSILCDHDNCDKEALSKAFRMITMKMKKKEVEPLPETWSLVLKAGNKLLGDRELTYLIKPVEKFARISYESRAGIRRRRNKAPLNDPALLGHLLMAHARLNHGNECIFLLQNLRAIGAKIDLQHILRAAKTIAFTSARDQSQKAVMSFISITDANPAPLCDFLLQEVRREGYAVDHLVVQYCLQLHRRRMTSCRHNDQHAATNAANKRYSAGKTDSLMTASKEMLDFAKKHGNMASTDPADDMSKKWTLRHVLQSYLAVQHMKQAAELLEAIQRGDYGVELSSRFYDPFTNYYGVRGRVDKFNSVVQRMTNSGVLPSDKIAEQALMCYIIAAHKGMCELADISDKVQEMFNAHRVRPSPTGMVRLVDYLLYIGDEQEARRAVVLIRQLFSDREREVEVHWPSLYTPQEFNEGKIDLQKFQSQFPAKGNVYTNGICRGDVGVLTDRAMAVRFEKLGYSLVSTVKDDAPLWRRRA